MPTLGPARLIWPHRVGQISGTLGPSQVDAARRWRPVTSTPPFAPGAGRSACRVTFPVQAVPFGIVGRRIYRRPPGVQQRGEGQCEPGQPGVGSVGDCCPRRRRRGEADLKAVPTASSPPPEHHSSGGLELGQVIDQRQRATTDLLLVLKPAHPQDRSQARGRTPWPPSGWSLERT